MTLIDEVVQDAFHSAQVSNPRSDDFQLPAAELLGLATVPAVLECEQLDYLIETEAELLRFP